MGLARAWGGGAWGSAVRALPSGDSRGFVVPDGLGGEHRNYLIRTQTRSPWGLGAWGGRGTNVVRAAAGVVFPNADLAVMEVVAWWAYASTVGLARIHPDGTRVPVRGQPRTVRGTTRRNDSLNPGCAGAQPLRGWNAVGATPAPELITAGSGQAFPDKCSAAARFTAPSSGVVAATLPVVATALTRVESFAVRVSAAASTLSPSRRLFPSPRLYPSSPIGATLTTSWYDSGGLYMRDTTIALPPTLITRSPALGWQRAVAVLEPPAGATSGITTVTVRGVKNGAHVDFTAHLSEVGTAVRPFFDGSAVGGNWLGDVGASPATLAPTVRLIDGECPLDVPIYYEISNPDLPGVRVLTDSVQLDSRGDTWMTDPLAPERPFQVLIAQDPDRTYELDVQAFTVAGRYRTVVRTESTRHGPAGDLSFNTTSQAEHEALKTTLRSPLPKLIRAPADTRWDPAVWVRLGPLKETNPVWFGDFPQRTLTAPYTEVDRPVAAYNGG